MVGFQPFATRRGRTIVLLVLLVLSCFFLLFAQSRGDGDFLIPGTDYRWEDWLKKPYSNEQDSTGKSPGSSTNTEKPGGTPAEKPAEKPLEKPTEKPTGKLPDNTADKTTDEPATESEWHADFLFQNDLDLPLPNTDLTQFTTYKPHNYNGPNSSTAKKPRYAYATFMATRNPSVKDPYFLAIQNLVYRILWSPGTRSEYPIITYVAHFVTAEQRALLAGAGAIVRELPAVPWHPNVEGVQPRWKDLFAKLHMWNETEFNLLFFLDADAFPTANLDHVFTEAGSPHPCRDGLLLADHDFTIGADGQPWSHCEPGGYVFAGVPQNPNNPTERNINVGSMLFNPSAKMHARLLQNYNKTDQYDCMMAEQAYLNWQFSTLGAFPPTYELQRPYNGFFPQPDEEGKLKVVHEKVWAHSPDEDWLGKMWRQGWDEMVNFYNDDEFARTRRKDGEIR